MPLAGCTPRRDVIGWSATTAYAVGLIATDGCLLNTGRHIAFVTCDLQLMETFLRCLGRDNRHRTELTRAGNPAYRVQFGDVQLYRWLESIGLHQRKSLTLGAIDVPEEFFLPLVRGLLDGDGTILSFVHAPTPSTYPDYLYERLWVIFCSASRPHLEWLRAGLKRVLGLHGYLAQAKRRDGRHDLFTLKYGKHASVGLLSVLYQDPEAPRLERKWMKWARYCGRNYGAAGGT